VTIMPAGRWSLLVGLIVALAPLAGACSTQPTAMPGASSPVAALRELVDLAVQRIQLSDQVAAAKFGTPQPINDPAREQQLLDTVAKTAPDLGVDPGEAGRFVRDQIEASKIVQRGLSAVWTTHPQQRPTTRPNLTTQLRPQLNRITTDLLAALRASRAARHARSCPAELSTVSHGAAGQLEALHRDALAVALRSVCTPS
jgi:chorismate mutase